MKPCIDLALHEVTKLDWHIGKGNNFNWITIQAHTVDGVMHEFTFYSPDGETLELSKD
jgi:hypothetical protein